MRVFSVIFLMVLFSFIISPVWAQTVTEPATPTSTASGSLSLGVATYITITDKNVPDGTIVSSSTAGFHLSNVDYDPSMYGVVTKNPAASFSDSEETSKYPVTTAGQSFVRVSTSNGAIKRGDLITSSKKTGVGMKATHTGFVIGRALENYSSSQDGLIPVALSVHFYAAKGAGFSLSDVLNLSFLAASGEPIAFVKYVMSGLIIVLSFLLAVFTFGRIASGGIEAIGRNPLAARMIQLGIVFNVIITVAIVAGGVLVALFILRL